MTDPRWAVTLFSHTNELLEGSSTPDGLLADVLDSGLASRVEIDAGQHFRSFPVLDDAEVACTAAVVAARGASVCLLGGGVDLTPAPGVRIDDDAMLEQLASQVRAAAVLGAEGVRIAFGALPWPLLRAAADRAASAGVLIMEEVQGPEAPDDPRLRERLAEIERSPDVPVRLLLDTSVCMTGLPGEYVSALTSAGVPDEVVAELIEAFAQGHDRVAEVVLPRIGGGALAPEAVSLLITALTRFGHGTADAWRPALPWVAGVHLKYWDLPLAEADLAGETGALLAALMDAGFTGTVCSEWGGHEWCSAEVSAAQRTAAHHALVARRFADRWSSPR